MSIRDLIFRYCNNMNLISRGLAAYQRGEVHLLEQDETSEGTFFKADVGGEICSLILDDMQLVSPQCTCDESPGDNICSHQVALLRALNENITPALSQSSEDSERANQLLNKYKKIAETSSLPRYPYHLVAELDCDPYSSYFTLSFRLATNGRRYIIKNIQDFYEALKNKAITSYGKKTIVQHDRAFFTRDSQYYIDLIDTSCGLIEHANQLRNDPYRIGRYLPLMEQQFDNLFDYVLKIGGDLPSITKGDTYHFIDGLPEDFCLTMKNHRNFYTVSANLQEMSLMGKGYLIHGMNLHRIPKKLAPFLSILIENQAQNQMNPLILDTEQATLFANTALTILGQYCKIEGNTDLFDLRQESEFKAKLRFDLPTKTSIRGYLEFCYDNISYNPLLEELRSFTILRNLKEEEEILSTLRQYHFTPNEDEWLLTGEDNLYEFLHDGLPELMKIAEVEIEDRLSKLRPTVLPRLSMEVSVGKGIIEIKFDETLYSREELIRILKAYRSGKEYVRLSNDRYLDLLTPGLAELDLLVTELALTPDDLKEESIEIPIHQALTLESHDWVHHRFNADKAFRQIVSHFREAPPEYPLPKGLQADLRHYQLRGYHWLVHLAELGFGGILADDMGLGKTLQSIAYLLYQRESNPKANFLIVVPTSLLYNWQAECDKFAPELNPIIISGSADERQSLLNNAPQEGCFLITSYAALRKDQNEYKKWDFHSIFADEAQYIKNSYTQNARSIKNIRALHHFALTGTPMENSLADLWSIMDFCLPGYLKSWRTFRHVYEIPITRYQDEQRLQQLRKVIAPFLLRRVKEMVATELPDKLETDLFVTLSEEEKEIYHAQLALSHKTFVDSLDSENGGQNRIRILALLTRLRQICCSPSLFLSGYNQPSTKLQCCLSIIEERVSSGCQILVFSQFTSMLNLIANQLKRANIDFVTLTGSTKAEDRLDLVKRFETEKIPVFLISLKAGGVGLNLTCADTVIHFDPWWNQSVENQATDRTHRIGQTKTVQVIRLIAQDTIEEKILALKARKQSLSGAIITGEETFLSTLSSDDLKQLFALPSDY